MMNRDSLEKRISFSLLFALLFLFLFGFTALPIENVTASELPEGLAAAVEDTLGINPSEFNSFQIVEQTSFYPTGWEEIDQFGSSVAVSGDVAVIGSVAGDGIGEAFIFVLINGSWEQKAQLNPSDASDYNGFGSSVAMENNIVVVGSRVGAYIYIQPDGGWAGTLVEDAKLVASGTDSEDRAGFSVSIFGDTIAIGAPFTDIKTKNQGSVYIFEKPIGGWEGTLSENAILYTSATVMDGFLGYAVGIHEDYVIVGGSNCNNTPFFGEPSYGAFIFQKPSSGGWSGVITESAVLTASDETDKDCFGSSVTITESYALVGAPGQDDNNGAVYVYEIPDDDWSGNFEEDAKLLVSNPPSNSLFGSSMSVSGDKIIIGGDDEANPTVNFGGSEAYIFSVPQNWEGEITEDAVLILSVPDSYADFSNSVGISGDVAIVGAVGEDGPDGTWLTNRGAAYAYSMPVGGWTGTLTENQELHGIDARKEIQFGYSLAVEDDIAVISAPNYFNKSSSDLEHAIAYVYKSIGDEWIKAAELSPSTWIYGNQKFGYSVDISGDMIVIGSPNEDNLGAVYVFSKPLDGWEGEIHEEVRFSGLSWDLPGFGWSVGVEKNTVVIGSPMEEKVYIYEKFEAGWGDSSLRAILTPSVDLDALDAFGSSVGISNNTIVVGSSLECCEYPADTATIFVYERSGDYWANMTETAKLLTSNPNTERTESKVAILEDTIIVSGSQNYGSSYVDAAIFVYEKPVGGWVDMAQTATLSTTFQPEADGAVVNLAITEKYIGDSVFTLSESEDTTKHFYLYSKPQGGWQDMVETMGVNLLDDEGISIMGGGIAFLENTVLLGNPGWDENPVSRLDTGKVDVYKIIETPDALNGGAEITSNQPIVAIGRPHMGTEIMGYNGINSGANTLYLPMLFNNIWNYTSTFTVENTTSSTATYTLTFKDGGNGTTSCVMSGETLPGHGVRTYDVTKLGACDSGYLPDPWAGGAKIESNQPLVAIVTPKVEGTDPVTYNAFTGGADTVYLPMLFRNVWGYTSAFYVQNLDSAQNATITIDFYDALGHFTCRYEDNSPIGPAVTRGYWVPSMNCNDGNSFPAEGWAGSAVIESNGGEEIVAIGRPHMGTEVAAYNGFTEGGTSNYLPMLFRNMWGYTSAVYIQNVSGGTITEPIEIVFYDAAGNYTCTYRDNEDLADKATRGYWIPNVNCNAGGSFPGEGWVGSATIHTSGAAIAVGRPHLSDGEVVAYGAFTGGATEAYVPMLFRKYNGNESALYIQNLGDSDATVTITYYDEESGYYCAMAQEISLLSTSGVWLAGLDNSVCVP